MSIPIIKPTTGKKIIDFTKSIDSILSCMGIGILVKNCIDSIKRFNQAKISPTIP